MLTFTASWCRENGFTGYCQAISASIITTKLTYLTLLSSKICASHTANHDRRRRTTVGRPLSEDLLKRSIYELRLVKRELRDIGHLFVRNPQ